MVYLVENKGGREGKSVVSIIRTVKREAVLFLDLHLASSFGRLFNTQVATR